MKRLRVLLSAYYFSPYRGGESTVGWKVANELARYHDVTVLCGDLNPEGTTGKHLKQFKKVDSYPDGLSVEYILADKTTQIIHNWHSIPGCWFLYYVAYKRWQKKVYRRARQLHADKSFDVVHHLNILGYREPGYLWKMDVPFVWGPLAGASQIPIKFFKVMGGRGFFRWALRNLLNWFQMRLSVRLRHVAKKASQIWTVSIEDQKMVSSIFGGECDLLIETGADLLGFSDLKTKQQGEPLLLVWSGLHSAAKALPLVLHALSKLSKNSNWKLLVLGDGGERANWEKLSRELGISNDIEWKGMLSKEKAMELVSKNQALIHSSLKEGTPHVVLEALGLGLPVICHDACGMSSAVTENCGIKVPLKNPETSIEGFKNAIEQLLDDPSLLRKLSEGALLRAEELSWEKKVERIARTYVEVVEKEKTRKVRQIS